MTLSKPQGILSTVLQLVTAGILLQTLFFKFTAAEESVYIFTTLGAEPWERIASGVAELVPRGCCSIHPRGDSRSSIKHSLLNQR